VLAVAAKNLDLYFSLFFLFQMVVDTNSVEMRTDWELHTEGEVMQEGTRVSRFHSMYGLKDRKKG
jgi:hypothetical protein